MAAAAHGFTLILPIMATAKSPRRARTAVNSTKPAAKRKTAGRGKLAPGRVARGLTAMDVPIPLDSTELAQLSALVMQAGGAPIGAYREPLGARPILLASLP